MNLATPTLPIQKLSIQRLVIQTLITLTEPK